MAKIVNMGPCVWGGESLIENNKKALVCEECEGSSIVHTFRNLEERKKHLQTEHKIFKCGGCDKTWKS